MLMDSVGIDYYEGDPDRPKEQHVFFKQPWNSETQNKALAARYLTPNSHFYVRNHGPVPETDADASTAHTITFGNASSLPGPANARSLSLAQLSELFPEKTVTSIMQCAGNRAAENIDVNGPSGFSGTPYETIGIGMMGNAQWSGVRLRDVIAHLYPAAVRSEAAMAGKHVCFEGADNYGTSTPLARIMDDSADVLLATKMNGAPLPADHGYPVRVLLPGIAGARNVKWLTSVTLSDAESEMAWQANYYKDDMSAEAPGVKVSIQGLPMQSMVLSPEEGERVAVTVSASANGTIGVRGIAYSGYTGSKITKVEVSTDGGKEWEPATINEGDLTAHADDSKRHYVRWVRWEADIKAPSGKSASIMCRAVTADGTTQPIKGGKHGGYLYNGCHSVQVEVAK
eukprot:g1114.t1